MQRKITELKEKRMNLITQSRELLEREDIDQEQYQRMQTDIDSLTDKIKMMERQLELERQLGQNSEGQGQRGQGGDDQEERTIQAFRSYLQTGVETELRALQQTDPAQAGYLVAPENFVATLIEGLNNIVFIRQRATVHTLKGAQSLGYPQKTSNASSPEWTNEITQAGEDDSLSFGKREFKPNFLSKLIKVSLPLMMNAAINPEQIVKNEMEYVFGITEENAFLTGDGNKKPLGLFVPSDNGIPISRDVSDGNTATSITFDGLNSAKYSLKKQYRKDGLWIFHRDGIKQIAKLKDNDGKYLWQPSVQAGQPDKILNLFVEESEYAPNTFTTGQYVGLLGNLKYYWICDSLQFFLQRLMEKYALTNQIGFLCRKQTDGMPVLAEAFTRVKLG